MKLYFYGHEMVSQPKYPAVESTAGLAHIKSQMVQVMIRHGLRGLAAPQIGHLMQMVVIKLDSGCYLDIINPRVTRMIGAEEEELESCISCPPPNNVCKVYRVETVQVNAANIHDVENVAHLRFEGKDARVVQHELDHLDGVFFHDRASRRDRDLVLNRFKDWRKQWLTNQQRIKHGDSSANTSKA